MFQRSELRFERFTSEAHYHSAYNFLSLRGVLAERWGHGPLFGAFNDLGHQITLTPEIQVGVSVRPMQAFYGLKGTGFNWESLDDADEAARISNEWITDAYTVLAPRRTVRLNVNWFVLYPITNHERVSKRLRDAYYAPGAALNALKPARFSTFHNAVDMLFTEGPLMTGLVIGVVGPPHDGTFFSSPNAARDSRWWLGVRYHSSIADTAGIEQPTEALAQLVSDTRVELEHIISTAFPKIIE